MGAPSLLIVGARAGDESSLHTHAAELVASALMYRRQWHTGGSYFAPGDERHTDRVRERC